MKAQANTQAAGFGRRTGPRTVSCDGPVRSGATYVVRYTMRMNWIALLILGMAATSARDLLQPAGSEGLKVVPMTGMDPMLICGRAQS